MASSKSRNFDCVLYLPEDALREKLSDLWPKIDWYAWIVHDQDPLDPTHPDDGLKKWHIHLVLRTRSPLNCGTIRNWFYYKQQLDDGSFREDKAIVSASYNPVGACRYLQHLDDPIKHQYPRTDVHTNKEDYDKYLELEDAGTDLVRECVIDLLNGWSVEDVTEKYGKIFVMYRRQILQTVSDLKRDRELRVKYEVYMMEVLAHDYWRDYVRYRSEGKLKECDRNGQDPAD